MCIYALGGKTCIYIIYYSLEFGSIILVLCYLFNVLKLIVLEQKRVLQTIIHNYDLSNSLQDRCGLGG